MHSHVVSQKRKLICVASDMRAMTSSAVKEPDYESPSKSRTKANCGRQLATKREGPKKFASILSDMARQLAAMDRYERRARCHGASLRSGLSMRHEGKPPARASNERMIGLRRPPRHLDCSDAYYNF
jgi:hypothetical protein